MLNWETKRMENSEYENGDSIQPILEKRENEPRGVKKKWTMKNGRHTKSVWVLFEMLSEYQFFIQQDLTFIFFLSLL